MQENTPQPYGFWVIIRNREDAIYAAKLTGLPAFLMGASSLVASVRYVLLGALEGYVLVLLAACLIGLGVAVRQGRFALVPVVAGIGLINALTNMAFGNPAVAIFNLFILVVIASGVRGWLWLRNNPAL